MASRGVRAAGTIPRVSWATTRPRAVPVRSGPREEVARRGRICAAACPSSSGARNARNWPGGAEHPAGPRAVGIRVEIVERDAASARAAARNGEADSFSTDWYADYPDPENFNYPLFHSRNRGSGGNYAFLSEPALDLADPPARATADTGGEGAGCRARSTQRDLRASALDFPLVPDGSLGRAARRSEAGGFRSSSTGSWTTVAPAGAARDAAARTP